MKHILSALLITLVTVIGFSMYQQQDVGYIKLQFADFVFETSLLVLLAATLVAAFVLSMLWRMLAFLGGLCACFGSKRRQRLRNKARQALDRGLIELAEGRFAKAEKILLQHIRHSDTPLIAYLAAARAAQQQGAHERRDRYLRRAHDIAPQADIAINLTQAELQMSQHQYEQALAGLTVLAEKAPGHAHIIKLLAQCYRHLRDWDKLRALLPDIRKHAALTSNETRQLEIAAWCGTLSEAAADASGEHSLQALWQQMPAHLKTLPQVVQCYARSLLASGAAAEAGQLLRDTLNRQWDDKLMAYYAGLDVANDAKQLETAETWLQEHPNNAHLLHMLGRLCLRSGLWGKARNYFEAALAVQALPQTYLSLARLLEEQMDDAVAAQQYYRQGLLLLASDNTTIAPLSTTHTETDRNRPRLKLV